MVVQRLKRVPSIIGKLNRFSSMNLARMQDIGGLRAIVNTVNQVYTLNQIFKESRFKHKLVREYDYIENPKASGYRSIHLVYKYFNSRAPAFDGLQLELQIRTKLQHSWATAVETMGTFLDHSLKSSEGPEQWLKFFSMTGSAFASLEKSPLLYEYKDLTEKTIIKELIQGEKQLNLIDRLKTFGSTVQAIEKYHKNYKYYLLLLNVKKGSVRFEGFHSGQLDLATEKYMHYEKILGDQVDEQIVLVSGESFKSLKRAYPNYFLDTHEFIEKLRKLFIKYG